MGFGTFGTEGISHRQPYRRTYSSESNWDSASGTTRQKPTAAEQKLKKLQYSFTLISSQIVTSKTSVIARRVASRARRQTVLLRRKRATGNYDEVEIQAAITHSAAIERVAKKRVKHLQEEERIKRSEHPCEAELEEEMKESAEIDTEKELAEENEEISRELSREMEKLMREYEEMMRQSMAEYGGILEELEEETSGGVKVDMDPADLKALKQKHRNKELQEIAKADAKYLRTMFQKYQSERQMLSSGSGVIVSIGGTEMSAGVVDMRSAADVVESGAAAAAAEGGAVDVSV